MSLALGGRHSIGARLVVLALAVLVPLVGLQAVYLADKFDAAREKTLRETQRLAHTLRAHIDDHVGNVDGLLQTVAAAVPMRPDFIDSGNGTLHAIRNGLPDHFGSVSLILADGTMLYSAESPPPSPGSVNVADRGYFKQALVTDGIHTSPPIVSRTSGQWISVMARQVRDAASGAVVGVVSASTRLAHFQSIFEGAELPPGSIVTLFNRDGIVLARSLDPEQWVGKNISEVASTQLALRETEGAGELKSADGVVRFTAFASATRAPWVVYVGIPTDVALAAARADLWRYGVGTLLVAILAIVAAGGIARTITRPLRQLQSDAAILARGDLGHRTAVQDQGEIAELATRFNAMADSLDRQTAQLREAENQYRTTFELAAIGVALLAPDGRWLRVNQRLCEIVGYTQEELLTLTFQDITHLDDLDSDLALVHQILAGEIDTYSMEKRYRRKDGASIWINLTVALVRTPSDEPDYFISVVEDIDRRKRAEALLVGQREVLEQIACGMPLKTSLETLLRTVEAQTPDMRCSILLLDSDGIHVRHGAAPRLPDAFVAAIDGAPIGPRAGSCGTAAWSGRQVIVEDIDADPLWDDYRALAQRFGLRACWSTPVFDAQRTVLGTFAVYYDRPARPTEEHLRLIEFATQLAAIALARAREDNIVRASETMLRQYVENTPAAIAMLDTEMRYLLTSRRWLSDYRLAEGDIIGRSHYEIFSEIPEHWKDIHRRCLAGAVERAEADPFPRVDGTTDWVRWEVRPWYRAEGTIGGITIFSEVITERVRAEQALRDTTLRLGAAVRAGNVGLWDWDLRTDTVFFSREWKRQIGYEDEEISADFEEWRSRVHPDELQRTLDAVDAFLHAPRADYGIEFRLRHKDGSYRWIFAQASLELDERGAPIRMMGSHVDVTEQRRLVAEKIELGERLSRLLESINEGFVQLDRDWNFLYLNRRGGELIGMPPDALRGQKVFEAFPEVANSPFHDACLRVLRGRRSVVIEQYFDRWACWFETRIYPLDDGLTIFFTDITERKGTDAALRQAADELRALSARLADAQEAERRALAIELHDQVGQNLTALNLTFTLLRGDIAPLDQPVAVARINDGIDLVSETVAQVRDLMVDLRPPMLDDYGLLAALRWYVDRFATRCGIEAHVDGIEPAPRLPNRAEIALFRIAQEALNNVLKHAGARHVHVLLDSFEKVIELVIEDDGRGFDAAGAGHGGPGWGIAGMRERAAAVGGTLQFETIPGDGVRVVVRLDRT